jgi:predicted metalloprotease with PDZ domain
VQPRVLPHLARQAHQARRVRPYDLDRENHTRLLWVFEGFTSYYDDLMLVRSGVIGVDDYLKALSARRSRT